jgi:hypothetical protein
MALRLRDRGETHARCELVTKEIHAGEEFLDVTLWRYSPEAVEEILSYLVARAAAGPKKAKKPVSAEGGQQVLKGIGEAAAGDPKTRPN